MGQGYSLATLPADAGTFNDQELADLTFEKTLGSARFLRTVRARHHDGVLLVKFAGKSSPAVNFRKQVKALKAERNALANIPNVLPYQRVLETISYGFLARQYMHSTLYDRISIRPFLEGIEKKWIAYQLLCAIKDCHSRSVFHGDIKTENVLVTSWGWVYLTDFSASFKPVYLPLDNPADFTFYFDTSGRRTCYLAPERFLEPGQQPHGERAVNWSMDIFSAGCVIAELFMEAPIFTLHQLFAYIKGNYDPTLVLLNKIDDDQIRNLITSMIRLNPEERWHAQDYLDEYRNKAFPLYFYQHLHPLIQEITDPTSGCKAVVVGEINNGESDDRIERIYRDFDTLSVSLGYSSSPSSQAINKAPRVEFGSGLFPLEIDVPNNRHRASTAKHGENDNGTLILLNVVVSALRSTARAISRMHACEILLAFAERLPDEAKLDRVLPYLVLLLDDENEMVRVAALRSITQLLALVTVVSPVNAFLFPQYLLPRLHEFVTERKTKGYKGSPTVRITYAACLASLAETASRFLNMMQALRADGSLPSSTNTNNEEDMAAYAAFHDHFDQTRADIEKIFEAQTKLFLTDIHASVRRAFLGSVSSLCVFFGDAKASDIILSHLNTYLNDPDWMLKCAFFKAIVGIAVYIGGASLEEFILPLMVQALTDPQEFVVEQALRSLASMAELGLLQRTKTWELVDIVGRFTMHPNGWVREAAAHFISASTTFLSMADVRILVTPLINPYLKVPIEELSESDLLDALKKPLPRAVFDLALTWAAKAEKGLFWKAAKQARQLSYGNTTHAIPTASVDHAGMKSLSRVPRNDEDEQWLGRLRNGGMRSEDELKIFAFREYLWRAAQRGQREEALKSSVRYDIIIQLTKLSINPQTILFDDDVANGEETRPMELTTTNQNKAAQPITEAMSDAIKTPDNAALPLAIDFYGSSTIEDGARRKTSLPKLRSPSGASPMVVGGYSAAIQRARGSDAGQSLSSFPSSGVGLLSRDSERAVRHRGSGLTLAKGTEAPKKALAEVATADTIVAGSVNLSAVRSRRTSPNPAGEKPSANQSRRLLAPHTYTGNDPAVLKLLDAVYMDNHPLDTADFGPVVQPVKPTPIPFSGPRPASMPWRPQGQLVAVLGEHTDQIERIVVAPDHTFFLTASTDGSVKVWDSARLERNVTHRSRQTHRHDGGVKTTSLCFIEGTNAFVSTGSDGSVHAVKVRVTESDKTMRYGQLSLLRKWQIPSKSKQKEYATWSEHFRGDNASTLLLSTNLGRILAVDMRDMSILYDLYNPVQHGEPTSFCISHKHDWLLVGTSHGVLDMWDLRFHLKLRSWAFSKTVPISRIVLHPNKRRNRVCISGGTARGEISIWDIEKGICHEVLRPSAADSKDRPHLCDYELRNVDDDRPEGTLTRVAGAAALAPPLSEPSLASAAMPFVIGMHIPDNGDDPKHAYLLSGGPDWKIRFWESERLEACCVVNSQANESKSAYALTELNMDTRIITEKLRGPEAAPSERGAKIESKKVPSNTGGKRSKDSGLGSGSKPTRYETIRLSAQNLLGGNLDTVTDVALLQRPFGMVLSGDRSGKVYVYQ